MPVYYSINALYALYWDIVMDWGMMQNPTAVVSQACVVSTPGFRGATVGLGSNNNNNNNSNANSKDKDNDGVATSVAPSTGNLKSNALEKGSRLKSRQCHHLVLRPRLRFGLTMSAFIVLTDAVLRFSWLLRFVSFPSPLLTHGAHDALVLCTQFLEIFRRSIWNLLRVEWENIKQQKLKQFKARDSLSDTEDDNDNYMDEFLHWGGLANSEREQELVGLLNKTSGNGTHHHHHHHHVKSAGSGQLSSSSSLQLIPLS